jgi:hypothetical protein
MYVYMYTSNEDGNGVVLDRKSVRVESQSQSGAILCFRNHLDNISHSDHKGEALAALEFFARSGESSDISDSHGIRASRCCFPTG